MVIRNKLENGVLGIALHISRERGNFNEIPL